MNRFRTLSAARRETEAQRGKVASLIWATLAGLLVPVLVLIFGLISLLLETGSLDRLEARLGSNLTIPLPADFVDQPPLVQLTQLTSLAFAVAVVFCLAVWRHRRCADCRASAIVKGLHQKVLRQSVRRAELEGAAAQSVNAQKLIGRHLPALQRGLSLWYRSLPRNLFLLIGCVIIALLVHIWLAIVAVISGVMVWRLYHYIRGS